MKRLSVTFVNRSCALVNGYGSRELLTEQMRGRPPVWSPLSRAWTCQPSTARDLIAAAESRGYDVRISEGEGVDPGGARW